MSDTILFLIAIMVVTLTYHVFQVIAAAALRIATPQLTLGFGPRLFSFMIGRILLNINLFPLGGQIKLARTIEERTVGLLELAGVLGTGFLSAMILSAGLLSASAWTFLGEPATVGWVRPHSTAGKAGILCADTITKIDGQKIISWQDAWENLLFKTDKPCIIEVLREGKAAAVEVTEKKSLRFDLAPFVPQVKTKEQKLETTRLTFKEAVKDLVRWVRYHSRFIFGSGRLFSKQNSPQPDSILNSLPPAYPFAEPAKSLILLGVLTFLLASVNALPAPQFAGQRIMMALLLGRVSEKNRLLIKRIITYSTVIILALVIFRFISQDIMRLRG
ncbi:MAG: site-2 protease family protein [Candidatus Omnitrophota bacterium]